MVVVMTIMGVAALFRKPNNSQRHPAHRVYPYILRHLSVTPIQSGLGTGARICPVTKGFGCLLLAVLDSASRRVLAWRLSNTLTTDLCVEAVPGPWPAMAEPDIFNTDQGCRLARQEWTGLLKEQGVPHRI